jgi:hypothetical protein
MPNEPKDRSIPIRDEHPQRLVIGFDRDTRNLLESLLALFHTVPVTLRRLERKVDQMAINLDKANAGLEALNTSFNEIVTEFAALKDQINDPASQAAVDAFGDKLTAMAQSFRDINPDLPPPPEDPTGAVARGRRGR